MKRPIGIILSALIAGLVAFSGCQSNEPCQFCPQDLDPVCGDNGIPYSNPCEAHCAGVTYQAGFCEETADALILDLGYQAADGCDFMLEVDHEFYHPMAMYSVWYVDSLPVRIQFKRSLQWFYCGLAALPYPVLELISIEPL